ncbi:hypothetical protein ACWEX2_13605 [Staphylococcus xylosus]|uniref:Uncharacterized protein n=1 Tax=Staphylococcus xylosus TaxID=1288 RepID=A0AAQ0LV68_STAXY|nr:hypothetical protein [Staphylococcus xylosus]RIM90661.1 hypothetical protein BU104_13640 [Staphylococcus xylosus]
MFELSKKNKGQLKQNNELSESNFKAFDLLAQRISENVVHIENEFQKAIDKKTSINKSAFSVYVSNLINLKNLLDYELLRYGSTEIESEMEVYRTLEELVEDCRMLITNNTFDLDETYFSLKINITQSISNSEIKRFILNRLFNSNE